MAKEVAVEKRAKISTAQQYMLLSVMGASLILGAAISLTLHFVNKIAFNAEVIAAEEQSIVAYSDLIKDAGICKSPNGKIYSDQEIKTCDPSTVETSQVPGTLRQIVLEDVASNEALNSVPKEDNGTCRNEEGKKYTYKELQEKLNNANNSVDLTKASQLIKTCSALRIIPDALPIGKNDEAFLSSVDMISRLSHWEPEGLAPTSSATPNASNPNLMETSMGLEIKGNAMSVVRNLERSIRNFDITSTRFLWASGGLELQISTKSYYMNPSTFSESTKTIDPEEK